MHAEKNCNDIRIMMIVSSCKSFDSSICLAWNEGALCNTEQVSEDRVGKQAKREKKKRKKFKKGSHHCLCSNCILIEQWSLASCQCGTFHEHNYKYTLKKLAINHVLSLENIKGNYSFSTDNSREKKNHGSKVTSTLIFHSNLVCFSFCS